MHVETVWIKSWDILTDTAGLNGVDPIWLCAPVKISIAHLVKTSSYKFNNHHRDPGIHESADADIDAVFDILFDCLP